MQTTSYDADGHLYRRDLGDGRSVFVDALTFGRARVNIGASSSLIYDDGW